MRGILERYKPYLPALSGKNGEEPDHGGGYFSLGEGGTPLLPLQNLPRAAGVNLDLRVKFEGLNPTGSFKDRGMAVAVAAAAVAGIRMVICASTGNTSASAAAYAARARMQCLILLPAGKVAAGKIAQAVAHNAQIVQINGNFDDAMRAVREFADSGKIAVVNSINPLRLQGQKTAAFEIIEQLAGTAPHYHALPVGNAGNITACWLGYCEAAARETAVNNYRGAPYHIYGKNKNHAAGQGGAAQSAAPALPVMLGYQAAGAAPFLHGAPVKNPQTVATAIRIGNPQSYRAALAALQESGGWADAVTDDEILQTQRALAAAEGIFCEPASAASVAGVLRDAKNGRIPAASRVVCTLTGHGLKDPDLFPLPPLSAVAPADLPAIINQHINQQAQRA